METTSTFLNPRDGGSGPTKSMWMMFNRESGVGRDTKMEHVGGAGSLLADTECMCAFINVNLN